jgi:hypothetical protein
MQAFFPTHGTPQLENVTVAELTQVYHSVKHHCSYLQQDCSIKVLKTVIDDSEIVHKMTCGRTKCAALVNNVLYPFVMETVLSKFQSPTIPFSVATNASNKGKHNFFPVGIQYFTVADGLCFSILDVFENSFQDSRSVKNQLNRVLQNRCLSLTNVTSYGADNASVNYGVNNSVYQKLVDEENKSIIAAHCNDHILHNYAKSALKCLSFDVEDVVLKVFAEFSNAALRRENLKECFDFCQAEFHDVIRHVPTRWLSLFKAVKRLLLSWQPLKAYFLA